MTSTIRRIVDERWHADELAVNLDVWVAKRRDADDSWREIARGIATHTGIKVSHETVRTWFRHLDPKGD